MTAATAAGGSAAVRVWGDPTLRMLAGAVFLFGAYVASLGIHQSLIATRVFGLGDAEYALVLALSLALSVTAAVAVGIATDRGPHRRLMAGLAAALLLAGALLVWATQARWAFLLSHLLLLPPVGSFLGQAFAVLRLASQAHPEAARPGILALVRALFALPFVVVLPVWGLVLDDDASLLAIYPAVAAMATALLALIAWAWPADAAAPWAEAKSALGIAASLRELASRPVLARTALIGAAQMGGAASGVILGLVFARAGRPAGDVGLFFGAFVAVEILGTLLLAPLQRRLPRLALVAAGAGIFASYLALVPFLAATPWVWALTLPAGLGGALVYTLAIGYLQDLLGERPGAGAALLSVQRVSAEGLTTGLYALGTWAQGYAAAAVLMALAAFGAALLLLRLDGRR